MSISYVVVCCTIAINYFTTTEHFLQKNSQVEHFDSCLILWPYHYVPEHKTDCDTLPLRLMYTGNVRTNGHIRVSSSSLEHTSGLPETAIVIPRRASQALDDNVTYSMYARMEMNTRATDLRQERDKIPEVSAKTIRNRLRRTRPLRVYSTHRRLPFTGYAATLPLGCEELCLRIVYQPYQIVNEGCTGWLE